MPEPIQSYESHARYVPAYHYLLSAILAANFFYAVWVLIKNPGVGTVIGAATAVGLMLMFWYIRAFPLAAQDRVIRLEEQLRYERSLPPDLRARAAGLKKGQIVALRFAHDDELPELVKQALDNNLSGTAIKQQITSWRADHLRV